MLSAIARSLLSLISAFLSVFLPRFYSVDFDLVEIDPAGALLILSLIVSVIQDDCTGDDSTNSF
jgi:hypothetical protein